MGAATNGIAYLKLMGKKQKIILSVISITSIA